MAKVRRSKVPVKAGVRSGGVSDSDARRCPLCGDDNDCRLAQAGREAAGACWCMEESFPAALLERVPAEARGRRCICRGCAEAGRRQEAGARP